VKEKTLLRLFRNDTTAAGRGFYVPCVRAARASRTTGDVDLRALDWHRGAAAPYPGAVVSILPPECAVR